MSTYAEKWVEEQAKIMQPDSVYWMNGSEEEARALVEKGLTKEKIAGRFTFFNLNGKIYPNSFLHRSHPTDVARTEHLTFVCTSTKDDAGPNNNWMDPAEAKAKMAALYQGCMKGRTMYVIPYCMGNPDSPYSKPSIELTDSVYVAVSMMIMTRVGKFVLDKIGNTDNFVKAVHSIGDLNPERRYIMHFPEDRMIMSFGSGYGGNALLGKKCLALRLGSFIGKKEGWLAEHMIIIGVETPEKKIYYFLGAFPSACGKTNLALLDPVLKGYKVWTIGDDIAWINVGPDGKLYAINPEKGFFGVAPGTSDKTNPIMMQTLKNDKHFPTLFTNTAVEKDGNTPWWEGLTDKAPANLADWQGNDFKPEEGKPAAHPNSRFTVSIYNCPTLSKEYDNPAGVPISGIIFGGRRKTNIPLVTEALDWENGVFAASIMGSETTAAATSAAGVVRRDPMAMLPFCGYNMADYFAHWLSFKNRAKNLPKIFMVNWFRKDKDGNFMWPGFRDNSRVIKWMIDRIEGKAKGKETPLGLSPDSKELDLSGLDINDETVSELFAVDKESWRAEVEDIDKFYSQFGSRIPASLTAQLKALKTRLGL